MLQASYFVTITVFTCLAAKAIVARRLGVLPPPTLEMRIVSLLPQNWKELHSECTLGLVGEIIYDGDRSTVYALDESSILQRREQYLENRDASRIFEDLRQQIDPTKQYVVTVKWFDPKTSPAEFAAQAEAAELGVAPHLAAGWVCNATPYKLTVLVMERMGMSLRSLGMHLCKQLTEENRAEVTRLVALAQRAVVGVLERLAQRGIEHRNAHYGNFLLTIDGHVQVIDFEFVEVDKLSDQGHEARKLSIFRRSLRQAWRSSMYTFWCLKEQLQVASLQRPGSDAVQVGSREDTGLKLLGLALVESLLTEPYGWKTFQSFVDTPLSTEPLVAGLLESRVMEN